MPREDVGQLVARLVADTEGLRADMAKAQRQVNSATGRINRHLAGVDRNTRKLASTFSLLRVGIIAAAGVMAVRFVNAQARAGAQILNTADKIGVGVEALQELRFAAQQYGIEQNVVDMALQRFSRRVGEAVRGQGELKQTLIDNNIQLTDSSGKTRAVEEILLDYADAVKGADSAQEALRLSFKAFDSEGAAFVNVLRGGRGELERFAEQARRVGIIIDREDLENLREYERTVGVLSQTVRTQFMKVIAENADILANWAENILNATSAAIQFINRIPAEIAARRGHRGGRGFSVDSGFGNARVLGETSATRDPAFKREQEAQVEAAKLAEVRVQQSAKVMGDSLKTVLEITADTEQGIFEIFKRRAEQRAEIARGEAQARIDMENMVAAGSLGLLDALGREHRGAAIAALAIRKALAVKEVLINAQVAAGRALAELGPIVGPPVAAKFLAAGKISAALIAATGLVEATQLSRGQGSLGTPSQPLFVQDANTPQAAAAVAGVGPSSSVQVIFQGPFVGWNETTQRVVIGALREAINDRDNVVIRGDSRQAQEILGARR